MKWNNSTLHCTFKVSVYLRAMLYIYVVDSNLLGHIGPYQVGRIKQNHHMIIERPISFIRVSGNWIGLKVIGKIVLCSMYDTNLVTDVYQRKLMITG